MNEDLIIQKLIDHEERLERIEEKLVKLDVLDQVLNTQDEVLKILRKLDQEMTFSNARIKRIEEKVEVHDGDIADLKMATGLA